MGLRSREKSSQRRRLELRYGLLTYWPINQIRRSAQMSVKADIIARGCERK
jgi:hypothetical protein